MKKSFIYLCLFAFISSCSSNILEEVQSIPKSRSIGYEPTWWNSTERLPAPVNIGVDIEILHMM